MSIQELSLKFKGFFSSADVILSALIVIVGLASFFLGRMSVGEIEGGASAEAAVSSGMVTVSSEDRNEGVETNVPQAEVREGGYVASKNGTKYHLPWCGSAQQIKEENKIWFATKEEAEAAGYTPASNCKGI